MRRTRPRPRPLLVTLAVAGAVALAGCSGGEDGTPSAPSPATVAADRPSSAAKLTIESPRNGQTVRQQRPELRIGLEGARIVDQTSTRIQGDEGHLHLHVDGKLVTMNYGLRERLPRLSPGQHVVQVEFVAADHVPFEPRVLTQAAFQVAP
jgi:hypothetical protein